MTKVAEIIRDALQHLGVIAGDEAPSAEDESAGIRALNLMLTRWEANGLSLGWSDVSAGTDTLPVPSEAEEAIGFCLALKLAPRFGKAPRADVVEYARAGRSALMADVGSHDAARLSYDLPLANSQSLRGGFFG